MSAVELTRRAWVERSLGALVWGSLAALAREGEALGEGSARAWWRALARRCAAASEGRLDATAWQDDVAAALREVSVGALVASLPLARVGSARARGPWVEVLGAPAGVTVREAAACRRRLFALGAGRAVVPHGHTSLASAFVLLRGAVRVTHYDRAPGGAGRSLLTATVDRELAPGEGTTISDARDNVHWLRAGEAPALLLNVSVAVPPSGRFGAAPAGRVYLDPTGSERAAGAIVARHLTYAEATARFG